MSERIETQDALRGVIGEILPISKNKEMPALDRYTREFIARSPFLVMGTVGADGHVDVSPRGDPAGFVKVLDDRTLVLPDRKGNRRVDSMSNILETGNVSLIFFLPGYEETLRIRGRAKLTTDGEDLSGADVNGKPPDLGIRIDIDTVFFHCAKALKRSRLWSADSQHAADGFPKYAQIVRDQRNPDASVDDIDAVIQKNYSEELY